MPIPIKILFAFAYDFILLCAIWIAAAFPFVLWQGGGEQLSANPYAMIGFQAYLLGVTYVYLTYFWTHNGQTPGLRVWKLALVRKDHYLMPRYQANLRFILGVIFCWIGWVGVLTPWKTTLQDALSHTQILPLNTIEPDPS